MQTRTSLPGWLPLAAAGMLLMPRASGSAGAPFGFADPAFNAPRFTSRAFPGYCFADGRGGLLWSFENFWPSDLVGANGARIGGLVRTTYDGAIDTNFVVGPALQWAMGVAIQTDLKILVGGWLAGDMAPNGAPNYRVLRYLTNGALDATYHSPVFGGPPRFMTLQPDGKLLAAWTDRSNKVEPNGGIPSLARLNADGSLDTGFQTPSLLGGQTIVFAPPFVDTNGLIYIAGGFTQVNGQGRLGVARLHANGALDSGFVPAGYQFSLFVRGLLLQPDGKVVIAGRLRQDFSAPYCPLMRLNPDGSFDSSFTLVSSSSIGFFRARLLRSTADGKLLTVSGSMARFNSDGSLDNTFWRLPFGDASGTPSQNIECYWFEQLADGRLLIPGDPRIGLGPETISSQPFNGSVRLLANGILDPAYSPPTFQSESFPFAVAPRKDGRLLVGGVFDHVGNTAKANLALLDTNGVLEAGSGSTASSLGFVLGLASLPDNRAYALLQGQLQYQTAGLVSNLLLRLQVDGSPDPSFAPSLGQYGLDQCPGIDLLLQGTKPLLAGSLDPQALIDQVPAPIIRFFEDGSRDTNFQALPPQTGSGVYLDGTPITNWFELTLNNIGTLYVSDVQGVAIMPDGKLLGAVGTTTSGLSYAYEVVRLNTNGNADASWNPVTVSSAPAYASYPRVSDHWGGSAQVQVTFPIRCLNCALAQTNGKVLLGGSFTTLNGSFCRGIARLNQNGTPDPAFPLGGGPTTPAGPGAVSITSLSGDSSGRTWITGNFTQWDGLAAPGYVRLNPDGSVDTSCLPQSSRLALQRNDLTPTFLDGTAPGPGDSSFVFGPHLVSGETWPRAVTRLVDYPPPPLQSPAMFPGSGFTMSVGTLPGVYYHVLTSSNLVTWLDWYVFQGNGQTKVLSDPTATDSPKGFYRVTY